MGFSKTSKVLSVVLAASLLASVPTTWMSAAAATGNKSVKVQSVSTTSTTAKSTTAKAPALRIANATYVIDGKNVSIETIVNAGVTWVSVRGFATAVGSSITANRTTGETVIVKQATTLRVKANDRQVAVNNAKRTISTAPIVVQNRNFMTLNTLVTLLGVDVLRSEDGKRQYFSTKLLEGVVNPHWLTANSVVVSKETDNGFEHYIVNTANRKATKLNISIVTDNVVPSPDGKHLAYTDEDSKVYVYTIETAAEKKLTDDINEKLELTWASDSASLFYIDGPNSDVIARINLEGVITKIVDDKVRYKTDLVVNNNNSLFLYSTTKTSKVTSDTSGVKDGEELPDFDVTIDPTGTEPQLSIFDASAETPAVKVLTTSPDNKTYSTLLSDGSVVYLSADAESEDPITNIKVIDKDGKVSTVILANIELLNVKVLNDKIIVLGYDYVNDKQHIYEVDHIKGSAKVLAETPTDVVAIHIGANPSQVIAAFSSGMLAVWNQNKWNVLTK